MSVEGVCADFVENSGEIKVRNSDIDVTIDNSVSLNSSFIIMGYPPESELVNDEGSINVFHKSKEKISEIDESAVKLSDLHCVEEWLQNRTELVTAVDLDGVRNEDLLSFSTAETVTNSAGADGDGVILPIVSLSNGSGIEEGNINSVNWEDFCLETESYIDPPSSTLSKNFLLVPGFQTSSENEIHTIDRSLNSPNVTLLSSPHTSKGSLDNILFSPNNHSKLEQVSLVDVSPTPKVVDLRPNTQSICKKLPFVKIPKNCLVKGKILGKSDISFFSRETQVSLLQSPIKINKPTISDPNGANQTTKLSMLGEKKRTTVLKQTPVSVNCKQGVMVLPVRPTKKVSKNSLLKVNQPQNLLQTTVKNNTSRDSITLFPEETNISVTHNLPNKTPSTVAVVAISTNKTDDTTEIVIKTEEGENVYKGKTSDIMKATGSSEEQNLKQSESTGHTKDKNEDSSGNDLLVKLLGVSDEILDSIEGSPSSIHLQCPVDGCNFVTAKGSALKIHIFQHYNIRPFKCDFPGCNWAFYTSFRLKRHQEIHYQKRDFLCPWEGCKRTFSTIYNLNTHLKLHERPTSEVCTVNNCNKAFQTRRSYEKHLMEHGIEYAPYTCSKEGCGKKYFTINSLNSHSRIHQHNEEELKCTYCGKAFDQQCRLKAHINTHMGVKPYKCDYKDCMWAFSTSSKLRRHQRKHTQMRKHPCTVCGKSFLRSEHLKDHSLKHFVKKSFVCPIADCSTVFSNKSSLYAHLKKHRNQEVKSNENLMYPCPMDQCDLVFNTKENLRTHLQISHLATALTSENSEDAIQMLSDENFITFENLQTNNTNSSSGIVSFNSMSQEGLLVDMSDLVQCIPAMEQGEYSESNSSNNIITHVVFTGDTTDDENTVLEESTPSLTEFEVTQESIGSARTGLTYQAAKEGKRRVSESGSLGELTCESLPGDSLPAGLHMASDVVLSAGVLTSHDNLERSLLLQDELSGGDLYNGMGGVVGGQEEGSLLGAGGELQVLLLDPSTRLQHSDFEQSTINLRDLE